MDNSLYAVQKSNTGPNKGGGAPDRDLAIIPRSWHTAIPELCVRYRLSDKLTGPVLICQSQNTPGRPAGLCFWYPGEVDAPECLLTGPEGLKDQAAVEGVTWTRGFRLLHS